MILTIVQPLALCLLLSEPLGQRDLCLELLTIEAGESRQVIVAGTYADGPETQVLSSDGCDPNVQPATWVEFNVTADESQRVRSAVAAFGRATVVFRGTLYGPKSIGGQASATDAITTMSQLSGRRYGHLGMFRTMLMVDKVISVGAVAPRPGQPIAPNLSPLRVKSVGVPFYPESARMAGVMGDVKLEIAVRSGRAKSVRIVDGHPLLAQAARDNVYTWVFEGADTNLVTTFTFRLIKIASRGLDETPHVELALPGRVTIVDMESKL